MSDISDTCKELLIDLVRERPCLWDKRHSDYKDSRTIKTNNWKDVTQLLNEKCGIELTGTIYHE